MEFNEQIEPISKTETDSGLGIAGWRDQAKKKKKRTNGQGQQCRGRVWVEVEEDIRGTNDNGKNTIKFIYKCKIVYINHIYEIHSWLTGKGIHCLAHKVQKV